jgi:hypothetical protein
MIDRRITVTDSKDISNKKQTRVDVSDFSDVNEFNHEQNEVSKAQKQAASQETTGLLDQQ